MDLRTHASVIWRWRALAVIGLAIAVGLTFFSVFKVSFADGYSLRYKQGLTWQSTETLLLTQSSCAVGQVTCSSQGISSSPGGASSVAPLYAQIANSGLIRARVLPRGQATKETGDYFVAPVTDSSTGGSVLLPFVAFSGTGSSPGQAVQIARKAVTVFMTYLDQSSNEANVPKSDRVVAQVVSSATPDNALVVKGRRMTAPILVFLAVIILTVGLIYVLENVSPRPARQSASATLGDLPVADDAPAVEPAVTRQSVDPPRKATVVADPSNKL